MSVTTSPDGTGQHVHRNPKSLTVEILLDRLGGFSYFQLWASIITISPEISAAMVSLSPVLTGSHQFCQNDTESLSPGCEKTSSFPGELKSVVQEWDLTGSNAWISDLFTSFQMFGALFGALLSGHFAERYGRKKTHFALCFLMGLFGFASGWAPDPYTFCVFRFFAGFAVGGCYVVYLNYLMEFLTPSWRTVCGCVSLWSVGEMLLALVGYFLPGWRHLLWSTSVPAFLVMFSYKWMPESPRWLLCHGRTEEAIEVFDQIARWNGRPPLDSSDVKALQKQILMDSESDDKTSIYTIATNSSNEDSNINFYQKKEKSPLCGTAKLCESLTIFKYRNYRFQLIILMVAWFSSQLIYYGISFNMKNLSGDPYMNVFYMGVVGLPGSFSGLLFNNRLGRRTTIIGFAMISALFLAALICVEEATNLSVQHPSVIVILCLAVRLFVAAGFAVLSCFTAESFPTVVRVSCMGICALVGNIGGILAPQFVYISTSTHIYDISSFYYMPMVCLLCSVQFQNDNLLNQTVVTSAQYITFALLSFVIMVGAFNLREMTGKPLEDFLKKADDKAEQQETSENNKTML